MKTLVLESHCPISDRIAVLDDDGCCAWLYLRKPNSSEIEFDAWVHNRAIVADRQSLVIERGVPPPAPSDYTSDSATCDDPKKHSWLFEWSSDGHSVSLLRDSVAVAFIVAKQERGFSRELTKSGPWGNVWSDAIYNTVFGSAA